MVLASRSLSKGQVARQEVCEYIGRSDEDCPVSVLALDLASLDSVLAFADRLTVLYAHIDILILNAGIMFGDYATTEQGYERQWGTNHLGHFFLVERLLPLLTRTPTHAGARVLTVSSSAHWYPYSEGIAFDQLSSDQHYDPL